MDSVGGKGAEAADEEGFGERANIVERGAAFSAEAVGGAEG